MEGDKTAESQGSVLKISTNQLPTLVDDDGKLEQEEEKEDKKQALLLPTKEEEVEEDGEIAPHLVPVEDPKWRGQRRRDKEAVLWKGRCWKGNCSRAALTEARCRNWRQSSFGIRGTWLNLPLVLRTRASASRRHVKLARTRGRAPGTPSQQVRPPPRIRTLSPCTLATNSPCNFYSNQQVLPPGYQSRVFLPAHCHLGETT